MSVSLILTVIALILGIVILVQSAGKDWRGWGIVICLAIVLVLAFGGVKLN